MTVTQDGALIRLEGTLRVEDAERLLDLLQAQAAPYVTLEAADHLHAAVVQILLAFRPMVTGTPRDPFLARWLMPLLVREPPG